LSAACGARVAQRGDLHFISLAHDPGSVALDTFP
jgi:hypothetical protein